MKRDPASKHDCFDEMLAVMPPFGWTQYFMDYVHAHMRVGSYVVLVPEGRWGWGVAPKNGKEESTNGR